MTKDEAMICDRNEQDSILDHPAVGLLEYYPDTVVYKILVLLDEMTTNCFNDGYECGRDDANIEKCNSMSENKGLDINT